ncbi:MAG: extracellular solute-binding protein [Eubacteriales bacterium]|nr:extracellular solute-binding protein [Eubacteriales bacterium]
MRRNIRGITAGILAAAVTAISLWGCQNVENNASNGEVSSTGTTAMGRYMESEVPIPEEIEDILGAAILEDGTYRMAAAADSSLSLWDSSDNGQSWEQVKSLDELVTTEYGYLQNGAVAPDGSVFCCVYENEEEDFDSISEDGQYEVKGTYRFIKISPEGEAEDIALELPDTELKGMSDKIMYAGKGQLLIKLVGDNRVFRMDDETGKNLAVYNEDDKYVTYFQTAGKRLYLYTEEGLLIYDWESGEKVEGDTALQEAIEANAENMQVLSSAGVPTVMCGGAQDKEIYYCNEEGIFRYQDGGSVVEQIADGKLNSLSKPSVELRMMMAAADGSLLVLVSDEAKMKLLRYVYEADVPSVPDTEIRVYSLNENKEIQQAVSMFQTQNPKYYVSLETGTKGGEVTVSDALRTLNTEIMAGNGPDVLILDGMPFTSYAEKGVLQDISDIWQEITQEEAIFENIAGAYKEEETVYAIPSRFKIPVIVGKEETLAQITGLAELDSTAKKLREEDEDVESILGVSSIYWLLKTLYGAYSPALLTADKSFDENAVIEYLTCAKELYELNHYSEEQLENRIATENTDVLFDGESYVDILNWYRGNIRMQALNLAGGYEFASLMTVCREKEVEFAASPLSGKNVFIPSTVIGMCSRSSQPEGAKAFIRFLFTQEPQSSNQGGGFPVHKKAFDSEVYADKELDLVSTFGYIEQDEDGVLSSLDVEIKKPDQEQYAQLTELVESLDTPSLTDAVVEDILLEQGGKCVLGEITAEEAAAAVSQKVSLYLAE